MTPDQGKLLCKVFTDTSNHEAETTKKVIRAVPDDKKGYTPDPKSTDGAPARLAHRHIRGHVPGFRADREMRRRVHHRSRLRRLAQLSIGMTQIAANG